MEDLLQELTGHGKGKTLEITLNLSDNGNLLL